ncbi:MAG: EamA family transporter, partial [Candidatus Aminicenantes bacterium]|nr:EamA family transporter [Candidatus Aminicenantes bacterium]
FVSMGIPALAILIAEGFPVISTATAPSLAAVTVLSLVGSAMAIILFSRLVQLAGALLASFVTYLIPVVALAWAALDGETVTARQLIALGGILAGVALVTRPRRNRQIGQKP